MTIASLTPLDLSALLCSRVCHDVISPVGAIVNGLEVLDGEQDPEMRTIAMELIKKSAVAASARLQFCRLAFGAAGSMGAAIDPRDAEAVARGLLCNDRTTMVWTAPQQLTPKNIVKLLLNLCLIGAASIPRGGTISVNLEDHEGHSKIQVEVRGAQARLPRGVANILSREETTEEPTPIDAHSIQPYYTLLLGQQCGMNILLSSTSEGVTLTALPESDQPPSVPSSISV